MLRMLRRTGARVNGLLTIAARHRTQQQRDNVTKAKEGKQLRVHLDAATIKMLCDYVSALSLPAD
jgi:hypothetical protein